MTLRDPLNGHSIIVGYILWIFGFVGSHRFYYGKPITGTIWMCSFGLLGIGWFVDLFLIPGMDERADRIFMEGPVNYNVAWILLTFLGYLGIHRFYQGKWISGVLYLCTLGFCYVGVAYDFWTLNQQISELNQRNR